MYEKLKLNIFFVPFTSRRATQYLAIMNEHTLWVDFDFRLPLLPCQSTLNLHFSQSSLPLLTKTFLHSIFRYSESKCDVDLRQQLYQSQKQLNDMNVNMPPHHVCSAPFVRERKNVNNRF